jgi:hypothetical protein
VLQPWRAEENTVSIATWQIRLTQEGYTGLFFAAIAIVLFTWQGLNLVSDPEKWLIRHRRSISEKHIRASRFIGWMFLAAVGLTLLQLIRTLYGK